MVKFYPFFRVVLLYIRSCWIQNVFFRIRILSKVSDPTDPQNCKKGNAGLPSCSQYRRSGSSEASPWAGGWTRNSWEHSEVKHNRLEFNLALSQEIYEVLNEIKMGQQWYSG
jgi:hypothetical protein